MQESAGNAWLVLRTKSRREKLVESFLHQRGVTAFLPRRSEIRKWHDRTKVLDTVLFPGYVFVQPHPHQFDILRHVHGSCGLLISGGAPSRIPDRDLEAVRIMVGSGEPLSVDMGLVRGQQVEVIAGPFVGAQGEFVRVKNEQRLIINACVIGHSVSVEIDASHVRPVDPVRTA